ncbi:hypothetical protein Peur_049077 [Populus x canadensis]
MPPSQAAARHADLLLVPQGLADPAPGICCLGSWPGARGGPNALASRRSRLQTLPRRFAQGCRPARPGVTARRAGFLEAPKARQTLRQVSACHGLGQSQHHVVVAWGVWPVQCPGLTPSYQVSAASGGVPPARRLYPQPHHAPTKQCSPQ